VSSVSRAKMAELDALANALELPVPS